MKKELNNPQDISVYEPYHKCKETDCETLSSYGTPDFCPDHNSMNEEKLNPTIK